MLLYFFPKLQELKFIKLLDKFFSSKLYSIIVGLMAVAACLLGIEIPIFFATLLGIVLVPALFCDDMTSTIPPFIIFYTTFSFKNNNTLEQQSIITSEATKNYFIIIAATIAGILLVRFVFDLLLGGLEKGRPKLSLGYLFLLITMLLGGYLTSYFSFKSVFFGLVEFVCLSFTYFYLFYSVKWDKKKFDLVMFSLLVLGFVVLIELIGTYFLYGGDPNIETSFWIITGWGRRTNIGGLACMLIPVPFYYAHKNKFAFFNGFIEVLFLISVCLSQSRGPILTGLIMFIVSLIVFFFRTPKYAKINFVTSLIVFNVITIISFIFAFKRFTFLHNYFDINASNFLLSSSTYLRIETYKNGLIKFIKNPAFGSGWYSCVGEKYTYIMMPARWHNTIIQLLATGGVLLFAAYVFHRVQTIKLLFKYKFLIFDNLYIFLVICCLLISSMFDCFLFNLAPGVIYSTLLVTMEKRNIKAF